MPDDPFAVIRGLLMKGETARAVEEARKWLVRSPEDPRILLNVGGVFIDAGHYGDLNLVREGVKLCESARDRATTPGDRLTATYNLANGLLALHDMAAGQHFRLVKFDPDLQRIASLFYEAIDGSETVSLEARLNLATVLQRQSRTIEAMDLVQVAVAEDPDFPQGWSTLADVTWGVYSFYVRDRAMLLDARAAYEHSLTLKPDDLPYQTSVKGNLERLNELIGKTALSGREAASSGNHIRLLPSTDPWADSLDEFVWRSGLGLNFCPGFRPGKRGGYDRFPMRAFLVPTNDTSSLDELAAEINLLVQGYVGGRALLWLSRAPAARSVEVIRHAVPDTSFSRRSMFLAAGFREAYGLLDRIAALLNLRLHLGLDPRKSYFDRLLFKREKGQLTFRSELVLPASAGLRALLFLSASFEFSAGRFKGLRQLRNQLQHSMVIPISDERTTFGPWMAVSTDTLEQRLFQMLRLARAAIFYATEVFQSLDEPVLTALREMEISVPNIPVDVERGDDVD
jgi:hypothetical protein